MARGRTGLVMTAMLVGLLARTPVGMAADDAADTEAPVDECVAACDAAHDTCAAAAEAKEADCARRQKTCDDGCATCTRMYGPLVVTCVEDCQNCRAALAASGCTGRADAAKECEATHERCLARCDG